MVFVSKTLAAAFAAAMDRLGPFELNPALAVAVSGGADSMALAVLTRVWVRRHGGSAVGVVVDHGLRAESGDEARITIGRLAGLGISGRVLCLADLTHGPALAERARIRRYEILTQACAEAGILHLLLGHHAGDQAETLAMRVLRGSQTHGLAGMAALRETATVRLLRPLLGIEPADLRDFLTASGVDWVEDPSNRDQRALRPRLRQGLMAASAGELSFLDALSAAGRLRQREEAAAAAELARCATIRPEGFALLSPGRIGVEALRSLIRTIGGSPYSPSPEQISDLAAEPRPATVAGVRILPAGRLGDGMLLVREEAAIGPPVPASNGAIWDGRFRLIVRNGLPVGASIGKLGADAIRLRRGSGLPSAVLRTLPAIRIGETLASVPFLGYGCQENDVRMTTLFSPGRPAAGAAFVPAA
jgi:tRNA(Ile)-lysidine synthase